MPFFRFTPSTINDTELLLRSGYTGELGYELYIPAEDAGGVWEFLLKKGKEFGLQPYGVLAMQSLRMEKAFPLYGPDMNDEVTPFHVGLADRWIRFDKREFVGREALLRVQETWIQGTLGGADFGRQRTRQRQRSDPQHQRRGFLSAQKRSGSEAGNPPTPPHPASNWADHLQHERPFRLTTKC